MSHEPSHDAVAGCQGAIAMRSIMRVAGIPFYPGRALQLPRRLFLQEVEMLQLETF